MKKLSLKNILTEIEFDDTSYNQVIYEYIKNGNKGSLDLTEFKYITRLPSRLKKVGGNLILSNTLIQSLPDNLKVDGSLWLYNTLIQSLPDNLKVDGDLILDRTPTKYLGSNIEVGGDLGLSNVTTVESLPYNLKVKRNLFLDNTSIKSLPNKLKVGGFLNLYNTPLASKYTEEEIRKMVPGVKGQIYLQDPYGSE